MSYVGHKRGDRVQVGMCIQRRFKSVCTSDQSLSSPHEEMLDPWLSIDRVLIEHSDHTAWMCSSGADM